MALGDGTGWNSSAPITTEPRADGADEIRDLRKGIDQRLNKEHETLVATAAPADGGDHREGSAKAYYEADAPTNRPDGTTVLVAADAGRIWIDSDNGHIFYYDGTNWQPFGVHTIEGTFSGADLTSFNAGTAVTVDPGFVTNQFFLLLEAANGEVLPTFALLVADASSRYYRFPREDSNEEGIRIARTGQVISITKITLTALNIHWVAQRWFIP